MWSRKASFNERNLKARYRKNRKLPGYLHILNEYLRGGVVNKIYDPPRLQY